MSIVVCSTLTALVACGGPAPASPAATTTATGSLAAIAPQTPLAVTTPTASPAPSPPATRPATVVGPRSIGIAIIKIRLSSPLSRAVATSIRSGFLVSGGLTRAGTTTGAILHIDLPAARVTSVGRLAAPVHDAGAASLGDLDLVLGGGRFAPGSIVQRIHRSGVSTVVGHLPIPRADLVAVSVDGMLVVVGGGTPTRPDRVVLATTGGIRFRPVATLRVGIRYPAVAAVAGKVYVIGGSTPTGDVTDVQQVDPRTGAVRIIGHLGHALSHASAFVIGGQILIAGGRRGALTQTAVWWLDPMTGAVTRAGRLPYPVSDSATIVVDGVGYLIGGEGPHGPLATIISLTAR